ncbi:MAG: polysaccharide deacetylase family protein [Gemmatimonadetes bacterium]|nr:polysaccharide deacetylase family protein [Gemmatimonadota bacterium]
MKLSELDDFIETGSSERAVILTFDDALASVVAHAAPILAKYNASATVFVTTDWTERQQVPAIFLLERDLWGRTPCRLRIDAGAEVFERTVRSRRELPRVLEGLWAFLFSSETPPLSLNPAQVALDGQGWTPQGVREPREFWLPASWTELQQLVRSGLVDIGSHGVTHTAWPALTSAELDAELRQSKQILEDVFQQPVISCAYPHGRLTSDVARQTAEVYAWAFANARAPFSDATPRSAAPRIHVPSGRPVLPALAISQPVAAGVLRRVARMLRVD